MFSTDSTYVFGEANGSFPLSAFSTMQIRLFFW